MKDPIKMIKEAQENNEPIFVIRAKDRCAIAALSAYNVACSLVGVEEYHLKETQKIYLKFLEFKNKNFDKTKIPD